MGGETDGVVKVRKQSITSFCNLCSNHFIPSTCNASTLDGDASLAAELNTSRS